jgi:hypothetical protein
MMTVVVMMMMMTIIVMYQMGYLLHSAWAIQTIGVELLW